ncbi:hypothetical protein [Maribacter sp. 2-571]|uniref:hypothetical protein n=1 Tax=Maribacter sp. 2-571 TaxID=3417569 RepID=UPI003D33DDE9
MKTIHYGNALLYITCVIFTIMVDGTINIILGFVQILLSLQVFNRTKSQEIVKLLLFYWLFSFISVVVATTYFKFTDLQYHLMPLMTATYFVYLTIRAKNKTKKIIL